MMTTKWNGASHLSKGFKKSMDSLIKRGLTPEEHKRYQAVAASEKEELQKMAAQEARKIAKEDEARRKDSADRAAAIRQASMKVLEQEHPVFVAALDKVCEVILSEELRKASTRKNTPAVEKAQ